MYYCLKYLDNCAVPMNFKITFNIISIVYSWKEIIISGQKISLIINFVNFSTVYKKLCDLKSILISNYKSLNDFINRWVFNKDLNFTISLTDLNSNGSSFQSRGPHTENALPPITESFILPFKEGSRLPFIQLYDINWER